MYDCRAWPWADQQSPIQGFAAHDPGGNYQVSPGWQQATLDQVFPYKLAGEDHQIGINGITQATIDPARNYACLTVDKLLQRPGQSHEGALAAGNQDCCHHLYYPPVFSFPPARLFTPAFSKVPNTTALPFRTIRSEERRGRERV